MAGLAPRPAAIPPDRTPQRVNDLVAGPRYRLRAQASSVTLSAGAQTANFSLEQDINRLEAVVTTGVTGATVATKLPFSVSHLDSADMKVPATNPLSQAGRKSSGGIDHFGIGPSWSFTRGAAARTDRHYWRGPRPVSARHC